MLPNVLLPSPYALPMPLFLPTLGIGEMSVLLVIILILFGPGKLPSVLKSLGEGVRQFKTAAKEASKDVSAELTAATAPEQKPEHPPAVP